MSSLRSDDSQQYGIVYSQIQFKLLTFFKVVKIHKELKNVITGIWSYQCEWEDGSLTIEEENNIDPQTILEFKEEQRRKQQMAIPIKQEPNNLFPNVEQKFIYDDPRKIQLQKSPLQVEINEVIKNEEQKEILTKKVKKETQLKENQVENKQIVNNLEKVFDQENTFHQIEEQKKQQKNKQFEHPKLQKYKSMHQEQKSERNNIEKTSHNRPHSQSQRKSQLKENFEKQEKRDKSENHKNQHFDLKEWRQQFQEMTICTKENKYKLMLNKYGNMSEDEPLRIDGHLEFNPYPKNNENNYPLKQIEKNISKENLVFKVIWKPRKTNELMAPSYFNYQTLNKSYPHMVNDYLLQVLLQKNYFQQKQIIEIL